MDSARRIIVSSLCILFGLSMYAQSQAYIGYPSRDGKINLREGFAHPPKGYGNIPFYWWSGDSLRIDRLAEQLDILSESATEGFAISYNHTHADVDTAANALGHGMCGVPECGKPAAFSEEWWEIWNEFSGLCADRGMAVGMDDYVFAWPDNKGFRDSISLPELHPDFGKSIVKEYFQPFEDHLDSRGRGGMNYFFQDEFELDLGLDSWCEDMPEQFFERKGYDIVPLLPLLSKDGENCIKVRLDYAEVVTQLAEERVFKPIYDWHASRGLIYGCDNWGRGMNPVEYMDYFRAISWFTAPGNDAPSVGSSFTQTKVSSSVAHLYERPRTWLEAFHSMGWDANGAVLTHQLDHHLIAGGNLLCMHGLYYSTHGGWWEWAPPCFHFRMPYWEHMKLWLKYAQRMCFVLSQGLHVCDIAILYPTETLQAFKDAEPDLSFKISEELSCNGYDHDFIDYQSLRNAEISDGRISVAGENYKVLVLADAMAMHESTSNQIRKFKDAGGIVIAIGGKCADLSYEGIHELDASEVVPYLKKTIIPDFASGSGSGRVLHRHIADHDLYMVMDVPKGDSLFFRSHGKVEKWDAMNGSISEIDALAINEEGTWLRFNGEEGNSALFVFSPGTARIASSTKTESEVTASIPLTGDWDIEIIPTMNNKWGDFRLPASDETIGVEARAMKYSFVPGYAEFSEAVYGYGPYMMTANVDSTINFTKLTAAKGRSASWIPYEWSWDFGVFDSPGSQGYHGLKNKVDPRFLILDQGCHQLFKTKVYAPTKGNYRLVCSGVTPDCIKIDGKIVSTELKRLSAGWHELFVAFKSTKRTEYSLSGMAGTTLDKRERSMVMLYPASSELPMEKDPYGNVVESRWAGTDYLRFDTFGGQKGYWIYSFETAPGTQSMTFDVSGTISSISINNEEIASDKSGCFTVDIPGASNGISTVVVSAEAGSEPGPAFFRAPVKMQCKNGKMPAGDWTQQGAMKWYSGGVKYTKTIHLDNPNERYILDLGEVDATCEVTVNGNKAGVLLSKPYSTDITDYIEAGDNMLEILVYSSLANHYQTIPSPYKGKAHAGLIGPVVLRQEESF